MYQRKKWEKHTKIIQVSDIVNRYYNPLEFQSDLALMINRICNENNCQKVVEVGCEAGITSLLLDNYLHKFFFDANIDIIQKVKSAAKSMYKAGEFVVGDMFAMNFQDKTFDVVFNSGVIEHFDKKKRHLFLSEYKRILKDTGTMVLAFPNHYSLPYRAAYILRKYIFCGFKWPYPKEYRLYDMTDELYAVGLTPVERIDLAKKTVFEFWRIIPPLKKLFIWCDSFMHFEGYLTALIVKKIHAKNGTIVIVSDSKK